MRRYSFALIAAALFAFAHVDAYAYTVIFTTPSTPAGTEQELIAQATTYFNATVFTNPFFPGTYQITLNGPAVSNFTIIKDSGTYAFIYGQGIENQRATDVQSLVGFGPNQDCMKTPLCVGISTMTVPGDFLVGRATYTATIDQATCFALVCTIASQIYEQGLAAPPIINGP